MIRDWQKLDLFLKKCNNVFKKNTERGIISQDAFNTLKILN